MALRASAARMAGAMRTTAASRAVVAVRAASTVAAMPAASSSGSVLARAAFGAAVIGAGVWATTSPAQAAKVDYKKVRAAIEDILDREDYDDGSMIPVLVRLAWHASGTYDQFSKTGGSNGATMRFKPECDHGANAGLDVAREWLEPVKKQFPGISYADLWTLAGVVAIEEAGGPKINWTPGRSDAADGSSCPPDGRLPDAARHEDHVRAIFYRMGFSDREMVALIGAHALGRCHTSRSGFDGPWTRSPVTFSNEFFRVLLEEKWSIRKWNGPTQYENAGKDLMMLPADMCLIQDADFRKHVEAYAKDEELYFKDFAAAYSKLLALGVPKKGGRFFGLFGKKN